MTEAARFTVPPVEKSVLVRCNPARAFAAGAGVRSFHYRDRAVVADADSLCGTGTSTQCRNRAEGRRPHLRDRR